MPEMDNRISLGNVLTIAIVVFGGLMAFTAVQVQTTANAKELEDHEIRLRVLETQITGTLGRIDARLSIIEKELSK